MTESSDTNTPADLAQTLAEELSEALDDERRYTWGDGPWEHLGDAERDVRILLMGFRELMRQFEEVKQRLDQAERERDDEIQMRFQRESEPDLADRCQNLVDALGMAKELRESVERENAKLRECVDLLRPEEAERFWHLYRTHPALASHAFPAGDTAAPAPEGPEES